jgi:hypothetical protein
MSRARIEKLAKFARIDAAKDARRHASLFDFTDGAQRAREVDKEVEARHVLARCKAAMATRRLPRNFGRGV